MSRFALGLALGLEACCIPVPNGTIPQSPGTEQAKIEQEMTEAIKTTSKHCSEFMGDVLFNGRFQEEHLGNRQVNDVVLSHGLQDLEAAGIEWCINGFVGKAEVKCDVVDRDINRIFCNTKYNSDASVTRLSDYDMVVDAACVDKVAGLNHFMGLMETESVQVGKDFNSANPSASSFLKKAAEVCERWQVVKP